MLPCFLFFFAMVLSHKSLRFCTLDDCPFVLDCCNLRFKDYERIGGDVMCAARLLFCFSSSASTPSSPRVSLGPDGAPSWSSHATSAHPLCSDTPMFIRASDNNCLNIEVSEQSASPASPPPPPDLWLL